MIKRDKTARWLAALTAAVASASTAHALATELVYVPVNPAFGGSPLNGPAMLAAAQAQNRHKDPAALHSGLAKTPLQQFSEMLERSVLSQLSAAATAGVMGNGKLKPGSVDTANFRIDIVDAGGGVLVITTTDKATGATTSFQIGGQG